MWHQQKGTLIDEANELQWHLAPLCAAVINLATNHLETVISYKQFHFVPEINSKTFFAYTPQKSSMQLSFKVDSCQNTWICCEEQNQASWPI